jgi:hypothetical protein
VRLTRPSPALVLCGAASGALVAAVVVLAVGGGVISTAVASPQLGAAADSCMTIVGTDMSSDIADLHVKSPAAALHPLTLGDLAAVEIEDPAYANGDPLRLHRTVTAGVTSRGMISSMPGSASWSRRSIRLFAKPIRDCHRAVSSSRSRAPISDIRPRGREE